MKINTKWKYIWSVAVGSVVTSTLVFIVLWQILEGARSGEGGIGAGLFVIAFGRVAAIAGVMALCSAFLAGNIIYRVNPHSAIGDSSALGVISGVVLVIVIIPVIFITGNLASRIGQWEAFSVSGVMLILIVSLIFGTVVCLSIAKTRRLFY